MNIHHYRATQLPICHIDFQSPHPRLLVNSCILENHNLIITIDNKIILLNLFVESSTHFLLVLQMNEFSIQMS